MRRTAQPAAVLLAFLVTIPALGAGSKPTQDDLDAWWNRARRGIVHSEYEVTWQTRTALSSGAAAWHAPNRGQGFRSYFTDEGIRVFSRTERELPWEFDLRLVAIGRPAALVPVDAAVPTVYGNRVEYDRGAVVEWYLNEPQGLEQGFLVRVPPAPDVEGPLVLALRVGGGLRPSLDADGRAIDFTTARGERVLRYDHLLVRDATDRDVPAWLEGDGAGIRLVVDDSEAVYPIAIDPLLTSASWVVSGNQGAAQFGFSVATAGDVNGDGISDVIVGAPLFDNGELDEGRAFVFFGSAAGLSTSPNWFAESDQGTVSFGAEFGSSVSTAGDVNGDGYSDVIVAAPAYQNGERFEGKVYVYHGSPSGPAASPARTYESNQADAFLGNAVSTAGDVNGDGYSDVLIGCRLYNAGQPGQGRTFVYHGSASGLPVSSNWTATGDQANAFFGHAVGTAGDVNGDGYSDVIVSAYLYDNVETDEGRAFVYHGSASGLSPTASWVRESNQATALYGWSVGTAGDVNGDGYSDVIVGALWLHNGETQEGRALVYHGSASGLSLTSAWTAESNQVSAQFGTAVGTAGDVNGDGYSDVVVGANFFDAGEQNEGAAFLYQGSPSGLSPTPDWTAEGNEADAEFGFSLGPAGDVNGDGYSDVVVGAYLFDGASADEGRAFVYVGSPAGPSASPQWTTEGAQASAEYGFAVGTAGDVNGDGYADVVVGAHLFDNGQPEEGAAFVFHGGPSGPATVAAWTAESNLAGAEFGWAVGTAGDVNGDGFSEVIVGAPLYDNGQSDEGRAFVYNGSVSGLAASPAWTAESDQGTAWFGVSVASVGDITGDGFADVVVGSPLYDNVETNEGRAFVYLGSISGLALTPVWTGESNVANAEFGWAVGTAGDVNRDGFSDLIVGAHRLSNGQTEEGRAYIYRGSNSGPVVAPNWTVESNQANARMGGSVGTAGDVNGDGLSDVIVGASLFDNVETDEGRAFVYFGAAVMSTTPSWTAEVNQAGAGFGASVGTAGDVDGFGFADVVVGASLYDNGESNEGRVFVYLGSILGLPSAPSWTAESNQAAAEFGTSVGTAGDVNGDGFADLIVGARLFSNGQAGEGGAFIFTGNSATAIRVLPRQRQGVGGGATIAPLGRSECGVCFRLNAFGRSPYGRGRVKLQWEVKLLSTTFTGTGLEQSASWVDTGTTGVTLDEIPGGLNLAAHYHWRARLRYHPATTPFQAASRWFTVPWNGWQEADLRTAGCRDADGDGFGMLGDPQCPGGATPDCNDANPNCQANCTDADGDGYCVGVDCNESNPNCRASCTDADGDGFCVGVDCNDANPNCRASCTDADGDGFCASQDCNDAKPNCTTNCTDVDLDGFCVPQDCNDGNANCRTSCTDADGDGFCVGVDCNDGNANCRASCTDADGDGFCVGVDCNDGNPNCRASCTDADGDGFCASQDCNDAKPNCTTNCTDVDLDGFCVPQDCNDANANCRASCVDTDGDGFCVGVDCSDANSHCTSSCTDADGDGYCVTSDCDDARPGCQINCADPDADGFCTGNDCDQTSPSASATFPGAAPNNSPTACMKDSDGDNWGDETPPVGVVAGTDCNDAEPLANPGTAEICNDTIDNDCDDSIDGTDGSCADLVVTGLHFETLSVLNWNAAADADSYALYRGNIRKTGFQGYDHYCRATEIAGTSNQDPAVPLPGEAFYYIVTGLFVQPGVQGTITAGPLGTTSTGNFRPESATITCGPRVYVDPDVVVETWDGLSWPTAYTSVRAAIIRHERSRDRGMEIWLRGTMIEKEVALTSALRDGLRILGGFAGTETSQGQRSVATNPTVWQGGGGTHLLHAAGTGVVVDGLTLRGSGTGILSTGAGGLVELTTVDAEQLTGYAVDMTSDEPTLAQLFILGDQFDAAGQGAVRAVATTGRLSGRIWASDFAGGSDSVLRLEARPQTANATVDVEVLGNRIAGGQKGIVLGAHVNNVPRTAIESSFVGSNVVHHVASDAVVVEASGTFSGATGAASAQARPVIAGNTLSHAGDDGLVSSATRTDSTGNPSIHSVQSIANVWDNLITFNGGAGIEESTDTPGTNLVADPTVVGNDLFANGSLYLNEGTTPLAAIGDVNALAGARDNFLSDPYYIAPASGNYHLGVGELVQFEFNSAMTFLANSEAPNPPIGMSWVQPAFDDSLWSEGEYGVGYDTGSGVNALALIRAPVPSSTLSVFTRIPFNVDDVLQVRNLFLGADYDDGYVLWINGTEVLRSPEMPPGPLVWDSVPALGEASNASTPQYTYVDVSAAIPLLQNGQNLAAIGVWNWRDTGFPPSSDLVLVPKLVINKDQDNLAIDTGHFDGPAIAPLDVDTEPRVKQGKLTGSVRPDVGADER